MRTDGVRSASTAAMGNARASEHKALLL